MLVAQGELPQAEQAFRAGMDIHKRLAEQDPGNAQWQRDLSVSHNKIGDVLVAQGELPQAEQAFRAGMDIARRLAEQDPGNAQWQAIIPDNLETGVWWPGRTTMPEDSVALFRLAPRRCRSGRNGRDIIGLGKGLSGELSTTKGNPPKLF